MRQETPARSASPWKCLAISSSLKHCKSYNQSRRFTLTTFLLREHPQHQHQHQQSQSQPAPLAYKPRSPAAPVASAPAPASPSSSSPSPAQAQAPAKLSYNSVARRITLAMVAAPIAIVTSYVLYQRLALQAEKKKLIKEPNTAGHSNNTLAVGKEGEE